MTKSPGALLPSHHKILPTPDPDFAEDSDEHSLTEGHTHPRAALVLLLLPRCQHIFIDHSQQALTLRGRADRQPASPALQRDGSLQQRASVHTPRQQHPLFQQETPAELPFKSLHMGELEEPRMPLRPQKQLSRLSCLNHPS